MTISMEGISPFRGHVASSLSDSCLLRVMGLNNMGNALVACCRIPDGSDIEGNINVITLHAAVKSRARSDCVTTSSTLHFRRGVIIPNETDLAVGSRPTVTLFESFEKRQRLPLRLQGVNPNPATTYVAVLYCQQTECRQHKR